MNMQEPIEKWRAEFESAVIENEYAVRYDLAISAESGAYKNKVIAAWWLGFLLAKRSQPVVELPKPEKDDHTDVAFYVTKFFEALADAGIQCQIKGD